MSVRRTGATDTAEAGSGAEGGVGSDAGICARWACAGEERGPELEVVRQGLCRGASRRARVRGPWHEVSAVIPPRPESYLSPRVKERRVMIDRSLG